VWFSFWPIKPFSLLRSVYHVTCFPYPRAARRAGRRIRFIGYLRLTGRRVKYVRVDRWESE
jgi:hypothetical protein